MLTLEESLPSRGQYQLHLRHSDLVGPISTSTVDEDEALNSVLPDVFGELEAKTATYWARLSVERLELVVTWEGRELNLEKVLASTRSATKSRLLRVTVRAPATCAPTAPG